MTDLWKYFEKFGPLAIAIIPIFYWFYYWLKRRLEEESNLRKEMLKRLLDREKEYHEILFQLAYRNLDEAAQTFRVILEEKYGKKTPGGDSKSGGAGI